MELWSVLAKCCLSGILVCLFALISEIAQPKRFSGLFSAAPSVLAASLVITLFSQGAGIAQLTAEGAVAGAIGMIAYCLAATPTIRRLKALRGSIVTILIWAIVALGAYSVLAQGVGW